MLCLRHVRHFAVKAARQAKEKLDPVQLLEQQHGRLLRVIKKRVDERATILSQVSSGVQFRWSGS
jgi:hypothetical protein